MPACGSLFSGLVTGFNIDSCVYVEFITSHPLKQLSYVKFMDPRVGCAFAFDNGSQHTIRHCNKSCSAKS